MTINPWAINPWFRLSLGAIELGLEAQNVVALRMLKLAGGGAAAAAEQRRMVTEKVEAGLVANAHMVSALLTGGGHTGVRKAQAHVRRKVRANRRRLAKR